MRARLLEFVARSVFVLLALAGSVLAQDAVICTDCHEDHNVYKESVHKNISCSDCHVGYREFPHPEASTTGPSTATRSQIVDMCARCHGNLKFVEDNRIPGRVLPVINYKDSVHGKAVSTGNLKAAICTDCHSSHEILAPNDPKSKVSRANAPSTCGQCHVTEFSQYQRSVHGVAHAQGKSGVPTCTDCHGIHSISHPAEAKQSDAERALGKTSCSRCHDSEVLSREYSLPTDRVRSYLDSYHGLAVRRGSIAVANCASCHGVHEILSSADTRSSIHLSNLPQTCGKCHPGASQNFARGSVHQIGNGRGQSVIYGVSVFYIGLIGVVIGTMIIHNVADFRAKLFGLSRARTEKFFTRGEVLQHAILFLTFVILALTGFALKWSDGTFGMLVPFSEQVRRQIHRTAGLAMIVLGVYHVIYLGATTRGRRLLRAFLPRLVDAKVALENFLFSSGIREFQPIIGFPSYVEKVEYWALIWGTLIMASTGLFLWFENMTLRIAPLWVLNLLTVIHYYEAVLATLGILVWHIYFVMLDPTIYPLKSLRRIPPVSSEK